MRILIVTMFGFNEAFKFSHQDQTAFGLSRLGHRVTAYAYLDKKSLVHSKSIEEKEGVKIKRFSPPKRIFPRPIRKALKEDGPFDLIHLHHLRNKFSYEITRYALSKNIPLVFEPHGLLHDPYLAADRDFPFSGPIRETDLIMTGGYLWRRILSRGPRPEYFKNYSQHFCLKKARLLIALSRHEKDMLARITRRGDIEILPHWLDKDIISATGRDFSRLEIKRPLILFVGQLKYRRGFDLAVKIFSRVKKKNPSATLLIVTNNVDRKKELLDLARSEGVAENIIFKENISEEEKFSLYKQADLYLSPTRYEGFGVTFLEAMACGCPIVASSIPVVKEIIEDDRTGLLARLEDPFDFYIKIKRLLTDPLLRDSIIKNSLEKIEIEYNKDKIFGELLRLYEKLVKSEQI